MSEQATPAQEKADPMYREALGLRGRYQAGRIPTFAYPGNTQKFISTLQAGASMQAACWSIGVSPSLWSVWEKMADEGNAVYQQFVSMVRQTRAEVEQEVTGIFLDTVRAMRNVDHRAPMQWLERYNPDGWATATRSKNEVSVDVGSDPQRLLRRLLPEAFIGGTAEEDGPAES